MMNFFGGFNSHKLKANLKMACQRVRLVNNKMDNMVKRRKKEISKLLESGKEEKARILVSQGDRNSLRTREERFVFM